MSILEVNKEYYSKKWNTFNRIMRKLFVYECRLKIYSIKKMLKMLTKKQILFSKHVLDIGFGDGNVLSLFKKNYIYGVEVSEEIIDKYKKSINTKDFLDVKLVKSNVNGCLNFQDKIMDIIIVSHVLEHVDQPDILIREISRVIKNEGNLLLLLPINEKFYKHPAHLTTFDRNKIYDLLKRHSFSIDFYEENGNLEHFTDMIMNIRSVFFIGFLCSLFINLILSYLPFKQTIFDPLCSFFGFPPRQLIALCSVNLDSYKR